LHQIWILKIRAKKQRRTRKFATNSLKGCNNSLPKTEENQLCGQLSMTDKSLGAK